ncbi:MAG TPA: hypothetical protein VFX03_00015, partial [Thermomicrobiales bacterium]|nr:hypothetical protein [Thermomicrobiales bacterium]
MSRSVASRNVSGANPRQAGHRADGRLAETFVDAVDDFVVGKGVAHRLARFRRLQRTGHRQDDVVDLGAVAAVDRQIGVVGQRQIRFRRQVVDDVGVARF